MEYRSLLHTGTGPGTNVQQKAGLNRESLKSHRGRLERNLAYQAEELVQVAPAYTSQTCAVCQRVDKANRRTRAMFQRTACGHTANAAPNTARNLWARGICRAGGVPGRSRPRTGCQCLGISPIGFCCVDGVVPETHVRAACNIREQLGNPLTVKPRPCPWEEPGRWWGTAPPELEWQGHTPVKK